MFSGMQLRNKVYDDDADDADNDCDNEAQV